MGHTAVQAYVAEVLPQHDLFRCWKEIKACKADAVSETDVFVSSTGNFNTSTLDHMQNLRNIFRSLETHRTL